MQFKCALSPCPRKKTDRQCARISLQCCHIPFNPPSPIQPVSQIIYVRMPERSHSQKGKRRDIYGQSKCTAHGAEVGAPGRRASLSSHRIKYIDSTCPAGYAEWLAHAPQPPAPASPFDGENRKNYVYTSNSTTMCVAINNKHYRGGAQRRAGFAVVFVAVAVLAVACKLRTLAAPQNSSGLSGPGLR